MITIFFEFVKKIFKKDINMFTKGKFAKHLVFLREQFKFSIIRNKEIEFNCLQRVEDISTAMKKNEKTGS
jgi:hypothetical protein